ncbi:MAG: hypothetical protein RL074_456 [Bacteroidota bacterium]
MEKTIILQATNISIGYSNKKETTVVASEVNLSLEKGKLTALIGANGIGKSTLLRTIIGIQSPLSGKVFLEEKDIHSLDNLTLAQHLSVVLTDKLPPSNLTVFELIALGRQPYTNWIGKLTEEDIAKVNEVQITLIARALAQDTPLIILDEPTTHLDLLHKVTLLKLLKKLTLETGKCILFSTHDIDMAIQLSDEMIIMTPESVVQDQPCNLIMKGSFNTLFQDEHILFDAEKGKFVIKG